MATLVNHEIKIIKVLLLIILIYLKTLFFQYANAITNTFKIYKLKTQILKKFKTQTQT